MPLYVTPKGRWVGSRAEAEGLAKTDRTDPAEIVAVDLNFPASRADVLALLNKLGAAPARTPQRAQVDPEAGRFRVYCRGQFVGSTRAANAQEACANIAGELIARECGA